MQKGVIRAAATLGAALLAATSSFAQSELNLDIEPADRPPASEPATDAGSLRTRHFALQAAENLRVPLREWAAPFESALEDVAARLGLSIDELIAAAVPLRFGPYPANGGGATVFPPPLPEFAVAQLRADTRIDVQLRSWDGGACPIRGVARPGQITIFVSDETTLDDLLGVLAHEVGHLFELMTLGGNGQSLLSEGLASWAAGRYWIGMLGLASLRDAAAHYLETGMYIPLPQTLDELHLIYPRPDTTSGEECVARRDIVYTQWAAFVEYLAEEHGLSRLYELIRSAPSPEPSGDAQPLDYARIYGRTLEELEAAWLDSLRAPDR